eukprot:2997065-Pyramimonas_sp.AAC.1
MWHISFGILGACTWMHWKCLGLKSRVASFAAGGCNNVRGVWPAVVHASSLYAELVPSSADSTSRRSRRP